MKYLCFGYFGPQQMGALSRRGIEALMAQCRPHLEVLYASGRVGFDIGVAEQARYLRRENGSLGVTDSRAGRGNGMIGGTFLIEAQDMEEAVQVASLHPTTQVLRGEQLGWYMEIRPVHYFQLPGGLANEVRQTVRVEA